MALGAKMLALKIADRVGLYRSWMPFIRSGGLFVPTSVRYRLGDDVFMLVNVPESAEAFPVHGKVVWVTPRGCHGNRPQGVGVRLPGDERGQSLRRTIETMLADRKTDKPSHTL